MIVVGNPKVLSRQVLWNHLLVYCKEKHVLVEGSLNNLKESPIQLPKPKALTNMANPVRIRMHTLIYMHTYIMLMLLLLLLYYRVVDSCPQQCSMQRKQSSQAVFTIVVGEFVLQCHLPVPFVCSCCCCLHCIVYVFNIYCYSTTISS